jgi:tRNA dimethylallyltransferase
LPPTETFSAGEFCRQVKNLLDENPDKKYILVGGTGLYVQSLLLGLPNIPAVPPTVRQKFENMAASEGSASLYKMACEVDPGSAANVDPNNAQRLVRILEVFEATGRPLSGYQKEREGGIGAVPVFWLQRERDVLYKRIDSRVNQMIKDGWVEEARELSKVVPLSAPAWQSLGYRELLQAQSASEMAQVIEEVKKKTRNYAKRQLTWFRGQMDSTSIDMENGPFEAILSNLSKNA